MNDPLIFLNNRYMNAAQAAISPFDPGFMYGDGVFETIRLYQGIPFMLDLHQQRLEQGLRLLNITKPEMIEKLPDIIFHLGSRNHLQNTHGMSKIMISRGQEPTNPTHVVQATAIDMEAIKNRQQGMQAIILPWKRDAANPLLQIKSMNYLENIYGRKMASQQGVDEGIFLNQNGELCEGTFSNLFLVGDNFIVTPPVEAGLLPGITRGAIIDCCRLIGIDCREDRLIPADISQFQGGFLSSSLMELAPLKSLGTHHFIPGLVMDIHQRIMDAYRKLY
ncbi:MAG: aminotransferase class IV [Pseudomonadota bacterium]|nr:aminotransferase class IV [Pseudomonadota bacterium]